MLPRPWKEPRRRNCQCECNNEDATMMMHVLLPANVAFFDPQVNTLLAKLERRVLLFFCGKQTKTLF
jgi:hypothetical protein